MSSESKVSLVRMEDLRGALLCRLCHCFYKSPHIISACFCTFCFECLNERNKKGLRTCPSCKISFDLFATGQVLPDHRLEAVVDYVRPYFLEESPDVSTDDTE